MNESKKLLKYIFLDTNVFYICKFFMDIDWKSIFTDKVDKVIIKVPYMVIKELDKGKYDKKRARQVLPILRKLKDTEIKEGVELQISIFPTKWESLEQGWKDKLDKEDHDNRIIAEVLKFSKKNPYYDVIFITGDNLPCMTATEMGINTIFWRDQKYKNLFQIQKIQKVKLPDLEIYFDSKEKKILIISTQKKPFNLMVFEKFEALSEDISEMTIPEIFEQENAEELLTKKFHVSDEKYKRQIKEYNQKIEEYNKYQKIRLFLFNNGMIPYNDIDIDINTTLEKDFIIIHNKNLEEPIKPSRNLFENMANQISQITISYFRKKQEEPNVKYYPVELKENEKNNSWHFRYHIEKLKHNQYIELYPIKLRIPDNPKTNKISFKIYISRYEEGRIKPQKLFIVLSKHFKKAIESKL